MAAWWRKMTAGLLVCAAVAGTGVTALAAEGDSQSLTQEDPFELMVPPEGPGHFGGPGMTPEEREARREQWEARRQEFEARRQEREALRQQFEAVRKLHEELRAMRERIVREREELRAKLETIRSLAREVRQAENRNEQALEKAREAMRELLALRDDVRALNERIEAQLHELRTAMRNRDPEAAREAVSRLKSLMEAKLDLFQTSNHKAQQVIAHLRAALQGPEGQAG